MKLPLHTYLKNKRADLGLKMREVVAMTGIDQASISKFENGSRIPTDNQITALAKCFEIPYNELKKYQLVEKVYEILAHEPYGYEAFMAAEPRIEYLATKKIADQIH
ncbi:MAG TPA: helix-turn-helix transcriptional regulator, partial [Saprospiraceae bacterium]|nr:helix-turn-helix transcriptional regulator [Saprospiraceae bacterium]